MLLNGACGEMISQQSAQPIILTFLMTTGSAVSADEYQMIKKLESSYNTDPVVTLAAAPKVDVQRRRNGGNTERSSTRFNDKAAVQRLTGMRRQVRNHRAIKKINTVKTGKNP